MQRRRFGPSTAAGARAGGQDEPRFPPRWRGAARGRGRGGRRDEIDDCFRWVSASARRRAAVMPRRTASRVACAACLSGMDRAARARARGAPGMRLCQRAHVVTDFRVSSVARGAFELRPRAGGLRREPAQDGAARPPPLRPQTPESDPVTLLRRRRRRPRVAARGGLRAGRAERQLEICVADGDAARPGSAGHVGCQGALRGRLAGALARAPDRRSSKRGMIEWRQRVQRRRQAQPENAASRRPRRPLPHESLARRAPSRNSRPRERDPVGPGRDGRAYGCIGAGGRIGTCPRGRFRATQRLDRSAPARANRARRGGPRRASGNAICRSGQAGPGGSDCKRKRRRASGHVAPPIAEDVGRGAVEARDRESERSARR